MTLDKQTEESVAAALADRLFLATIGAFDLLSVHLGNRLELDHLLAVNFGWWDVLVDTKQPIGSLL